MTDFEKVLFDPSSYYAEPTDVLKDKALTHEQKYKILKQWEYDAKEIMVAEEENMRGDSVPMLNRVQTALRDLGKPK